MTPAARTQAAIEVLDAVIAGARDEGPAADVTLQRYWRGRRYAGSGDRRWVRDTVFQVIRAVGDRPATGRAAVLAFARAQAPELLEHFGHGAHAPPAIAPSEPEAALGPLPGWIGARLENRFGADAEAETAALLARAPLDLRVNLLKAQREEVAHEFADASPTPFSPWGLRLPPDTPIEPAEAFQSGRVEVQDEGSQLIALACAAQPGETVVDLCAGAGGKTLALAAMMGDRGRIVACDVSRDRLARLGPRAERAGMTVARPRLLDPPREAARLADLAHAADLVLIDAPCSGTGTWRRNPEARWRLTPEGLARLTATQDHLLALGAALVRPGGRLVYAVCSVLRAEGEDRIAQFHSSNPGWQPRPFALPPGLAASDQLLLTPHRHGTDGFFIAALGPIC